MQKHTKIYLEYFGYTVADFIPCELCGAKAVDIAHIIPRSKFGSKRKEEQDLIQNIAAMCRSCHYKYDFDKTITIEQVIQAHNGVLERHSGI